jgi:hypothetical protein
VADNNSGYRVLSYDLNSLGDVKVVYTANASDRQLASMDPCGTRICLTDKSADGDKSTQLISVGFSGGSWSRPVPDANEVLPVGDRVMVVSGNSSDRYTKVFDPSGKELLGSAGQDQTGARVTGGSVLLFGDDPTTYSADQSLAGYGVRDTGHLTQLGQVRKVRAANCSWNARILVCPSDTDFGIWKFAG